MTNALQRKVAVAALIPAHEEGKFIFEVVSRVRPLVDAVLVVDDGSSDHTGTEARRAGAEVIRHEKCLGKGGALRRGLKQLLPHYEHVIMLDGDLQHVPEEIKLFVDEIERCDPGMIIGCRSFKKGKMPSGRRLTNQFMSAFISLLCGQKIADTQSGFRSLRTDAIEVLLESCETSGYDFESEMLLVLSRHGYRVNTLPISTVYGSEVSKIQPIPDTLRFGRLVMRTLARGLRWKVHATMAGLNRLEVRTAVRSERRDL